MSVKDLTICELWDLTQPTPIPHSRLYHLEPIGVGTMYVESLTSYVTRLAQAHAVLVRELAAYEIAPLLDQQYTPATVQFVFYRKGSVLNGNSPWTAKVIFALEKLTERNELSFLTMWVFRTVLSRSGLMRPSQAWCPLCYHEWRQAGQRVYNPLLWALQAITVCPQHGQPLHVRCPNQACQACVPFLASSEMGYCPRCQRWLGSTLPMSGSASLGEVELEQAIWQAKAAGELLVVAPYLTVPLSKERAAQVMLAYMESRSAKSTEILARRVGLPHSRLDSFLGKINTLRFDLWLDTCWRLGMIPVDALIDPEAIEPNGRSGISWVQEIHAEFDEPLQPLDSVEIQQILTAISASDEKPPPSLNDVARRVKCSSGTLRQRFPEVCGTIIERQQAYSQALKLHIQRELETILNTAKDPLPTLKEIAQQLGQSQHVLRRSFPELCDALTERRRAYHDADKRRIRCELEAIMNANRNPPPTIGEVAQQLERPEHFLSAHFPELCRTLAERQRAYREAERQCVRHELEAILNANENPPPTLCEITQQLGLPKGYVYRYFPELCRTFSERRRAYCEAEKLRVRCGLETVLDADDLPPPSLREIAKRLEHSEKFLRHFPELCDAIVERHRAYQESEKSRLRHAWEALLVDRKDSPPSLREVARQLEQPVLRLRYLFPDLYRAAIVPRVRKAKPGCRDCVVDQHKAIEEQSQADLEVKTLHLRQQLEIVVASDEMPPPSLREVAQRLESDSLTLGRRFPDLSRAIVQRGRAYQEAKKLDIQRGLEAILASNETPPPTLKEVARRFGSRNSTALSDHFPDLCRAILQRRQAYQEAERLHVQRELEAILASDRVPPPSLSEVALQLEQPETMLCHYFPDLYRAIVERYQTYRQAEKLDIQCKLEAVLAAEEEPAPSMKEIARRLGYPYDRLRRLFPEFCQRISARYLTNEKVRGAQKREQYRTEIRQATFEVWRNGSYPTYSRVSSWLSKPAYFRKPEARAAWREALHELGLSE